MLRAMGAGKVCSSRGKSTERSIKRKPRPRFPVRKPGVKAKRRDAKREIEIA